MNLNKEQAKSMSNFLMDIAKGIILGIFGFSAATNSSIELKIVSDILGLIISYGCVKVGMQLLSDSYAN
ncbi:hypothetical protein HY085_02675 [Candidatus Gottesmanbacteria bacterium]|nr:hypothetical protein [Candidatus Gottesmanbacteria bacterium]